MHASPTLSRQQVDFLHGPIVHSLVVFSIPLLISNIFQQLYNLADTVIVANFLGDSALAAIGACTSIYDLLVGFALGIGAGLSVVAARSFGSGDAELLKRSVAAALVIGLLTSVVLSALAQVILHPLLEALHTPAEILDSSYRYISTITLFTIVMFAYNLFAGLLRAVGNSVMPLVFLVFSSLLNILLDILFITRFQMGVAGAAYATVISQGISAVLCAIYLIRKVPLLLPDKRHFRFDRALYGEMLGQGLSMGFMHSIVSAGTVVLQYGINSFGTLIIAGHTTARRIYTFFIMPFGAMSNSISTFVAQNRGANQRERIRKALRCAYLFDFVTAAIISVFLLFFAPALVKLISGSEEAVVIENASLYLRFVGPFYFVLGVLIQLRSAMQSIGSKLLPLISSVTELVVKFLFVVFLIPYFGYMAVIVCEPLIWSIMTLQLLIVFRTNPFMREKET